jgi:uncharacterized repeat protein (TIGR01451 family)
MPRSRASRAVFARPSRNPKPHRRTIAASLATALLFLVAAAGTITTPAVSDIPQARIVFPLEGDVINNGTIVEAVPPDDPSGEADWWVQFEYSTGQGSWEPIDGVAPRSRAHRALWSTKQLAGGNYLVRARFRPRVRIPVMGLPQTPLSADPGSGPEIATAPVGVFVNEQPFAVATARVLEGPTRDALVEFDASRSFDRDGRITGYQWRFEDGTAYAQASVTRDVFDGFRSRVILTVYDDKGGTSTSLYDAGVSDGDVALDLEEQCGCKTMTIKSVGLVEGPPGFDFGGPGGTELGPFPDPYPGSGNIACRFEVIAELYPGSVPQLCAEGQMVQASAHGLTTQEWSLTKTQSGDPRYDSNWSPDDPYTPAGSFPNGYDDPTVKEQADCAYGSELWCDDTYHGDLDEWGYGVPGEQPALVTKAYEYGFPTRILWLDEPRFVPDYEAAGAWYMLRFQAVVSGDLGSCACAWEVRIELDEEGTVTRNEVVDVVCSGEGTDLSVDGDWVAVQPFVHPQDPVTAGSPLAYRVHVANRGPNDALGAVMTDPLPEHTRFLSLRAPASWICTTPAVGSRGQISCAASSQQSGATATFEVAVVVDPEAPAGALITDTVTVVSETADVNPSNNSLALSRQVIGI